MKGEYIGEFEEMIMLLVGILGEEAYGLSIVDQLKEQAKRTATIGAVHATLNRLENKGFLKSELKGATNERGGRRKPIFELTAHGKVVLESSNEIRANLWHQYSLKSI